MDAVTAIPAINEELLDSFGVRLFSLFGLHKADRKHAEDKWIQNLRQYRGIYDPEVLALIGSDQSHAYPKMTRWKIIGTVARLMQMLFPSTEKNYSAKPSPLPDLSIDQLQEVLDTLVTLTAQEQKIDPAQVTLKDEDIEKAIYHYAAHKAEQMEKKLDDDLAEMEFITLARRVVFSAALYNVGVLEGPFHVKVKARVWERDQYTGKYTAKEVDKYKPRYEFTRVWDWYPDMTANTLKEQDGGFKRCIMARHQIEELIDRPDFMGERVREWLQKNLTGNYTPEWWETVMKGELKGDKAYVAEKETRKYEVLSYWGNVRGSDMRAAGIPVSDAQAGLSFHANVWMIGNRVIKCKLAPLTKSEHFHTFVFEEDDLSLLGNGQCDTLRDSQLSICETARAALDNMSVIGPMAIINKDLMAPGQSYKIRKHKTWEVESLSGNQSLNAAVTNFTIDSHVNELMQMLQLFMDFADKESGLPPPSVGDTSGGGSEALRTSKNASMFLGAAALPIRDTVRNYDSFTMSVITGLIEWNKKFDPNPVRDGDMDVIPRGSTSLIAKEVLAQSLENFRAGITEEERPHIDTRKLLEVRAKANDIPVDDILVSAEKAEQIIAASQSAAAEHTKIEQSLIRAQVEEVLTNAVKHMADAKKADSKIEDDAQKIHLAATQLLLDAISKGHENAIKEHVATKPEPAKAGA